MTEYCSWAKIYRNLLEWGWYKDSATKDVFLHLILKANFNDTEYKGRQIKRGQLVTGRKKLAEELGITESSVRIALNHLKQTGEITTQSTTKYTVITVTNYNKYQSIDGEGVRPTTIFLPTANQQTADKQPTGDQQTANEQPHHKKSRIQEFNNSRSQELVVPYATAVPMPPTLSEVTEYCEQQNYVFDFERFFDYYERFNWLYKGRPIDWKKQAESWNRTEKRTERKTKPKKHCEEKQVCSYDLEAYENFSIFD